MRSIKLTPIGCLKMAVVLNLGVVACMDDAGSVVGTGGTGTTTGGSVGTGGSSKGGTSGSATGGSTTSGAGGTTGGTGATGGTTGGTGGTTGGTGGSLAGSGSTAGGTGGSLAGGGGTTSGSAGLAGMGTGNNGGGGAGGGGAGRDPGGAGMAGGSNAAGQAGSGTAGTGSSGDCVKGTMGKDVAVIGESFIAATHQITQEIEARAKAAGALGQSEKYVDNSVSGTTLANNQIPSQYDKAVQSSGAIKYVVMDGGGNDCLINNNGAAALTAATTLFQTMASKNTQKVLYFFYPDPIGSNFASLKSCLDSLRPQMKALCDGLTAPKCYWLDLRDTWNGHNEYTSDGIHPTTEGAKATGDVIWDAMVEHCVAQ